MDDRCYVTKLVVSYDRQMSCIEWRIHMPPSLNHEGVIALVRDRPAFAASLLRDRLNVEVPHVTDARLTEAARNQLVPVEYHADARLLVSVFVHQKHNPVFGPAG